MTPDFSHYSRDLRQWVTEALTSADPAKRRSWAEKLARETDDLEDEDGQALAELLADVILREEDLGARSSELFALADLSECEMVSSDVRTRIASIDAASLSRSDHNSWNRIMDPDYSD